MKHSNDKLPIGKVAIFFGVVLILFLMRGGSNVVEGWSLSRSRGSTRPPIDLAPLFRRENLGPTLHPSSGKALNLLLLDRAHWNKASDALMHGNRCSRRFQQVNDDHDLSAPDDETASPLQPASSALTTTTAGIQEAVNGAMTRYQAETPGLQSDANGPSLSALDDAQIDLLKKTLREYKQAMQTLREVESQERQQLQEEAVQLQQLLVDRQETIETLWTELESIKLQFDQEVQDWQDQLEQEQDARTRDQAAAKELLEALREESRVKIRSVMETAQTERERLVAEWTAQLTAREEELLYAKVDLRQTRERVQEQDQLIAELQAEKRNFKKLLGNTWQLLLDRTLRRLYRPRNNLPGARARQEKKKNGFRRATETDARS